MHPPRPAPDWRLPRDTTVVSFVLVLLLATAAALLRSVVAGDLLFTDADLGWHLSYGRYILDQHQLPLHDSWSWLRQGQPYLLTHWGGEVLMALSDRAWAAGGAHLLMAVTIGLTVALMWLAASFVATTPAAALAAATVCSFPLLGALFQPRLFSFCCLAAVTALLSLRVSRPARVVQWALPLVFMLWANLHAGFVLALPLVIAALLGLAWKANSLHDRLRLVVCAFACVGATVVSPYGVHVYDGVLGVMGGEASSTTIGDWSPTTLMGQGAPLGVAALIAITAAARARSYWAIALSALILAIGLKAARMVPMACIMLTPFVGLAARQVPTPTRSAGSLRPALSLLGALALNASLVAALSLKLSPFDGTIEAALNPVKTLHFLRTHAVHGRLWNEFEQGGWWIAHAPEYPVAIDGRLELYPDAWLQGARDLRRVRPEALERFDRFDVDIVAVLSTNPLRQALIARGDFALVLEDAGQSLLLRRRPQWEDLIQANERAPHPITVLLPSGQPRYDLY